LGGPHTGSAFRHLRALHASGCTRDWKPAENKFKFPCHGGGYDNEGISLEDPAPRPMDRAQLELAPDGRIVVAAGHVYSCPKGQEVDFDVAASRVFCSVSIGFEFGGSK
jgi:hypothetical protein